MQQKWKNGGESFLVELNTESQEMNPETSYISFWCTLPRLDRNENPGLFNIPW